MLVLAHKGPVLFVAVAFSTSTAGLALKCDLPFLSVVALFCFACSLFSALTFMPVDICIAFLDISVFACNAKFTSKIP